MYMKIVERVHLFVVHLLYIFSVLHHRTLLFAFFYFLITWVQIRRGIKAVPAAGSQGLRTYVESWLLGPFPSAQHPAVKLLSFSALIRERNRGTIAVLA